MAKFTYGAKSAQKFAPMRATLNNFRPKLAFWFPTLSQFPIFVTKYNNIKRFCTFCVVFLSKAKQSCISFFLTIQKRVTKEMNNYLAKGGRIDE